MSKPDFQVRNMSEEIKINCLLNICLLLTTDFSKVVLVFAGSKDYIQNWWQKLKYNISPFNTPGTQKS